MNKWIKNNITKLSGKTVAITGSTGGLGSHICNHLASGGANLILLNRSIEKTKQQEQDLKRQYPNIDIKIIQTDLADFNSVKQATEQLKQLNIDVLILNAGIYHCPRFITDIGYDNIFVTNFVSHYYMVKQLMPVLSKSTLAKVVAVGSIAHNYCKLNLKDIDYANNYKHSKVYGNSKRFLMFGLHELFKTETKVKLSVVHPGVTFTNITNHYPKVIYNLIKYPMKILFPSPRKASMHIVSGIFNSTDYGYWIGPKIMSVWGKPRISKLKTCTQKEGQGIFKIAENIYEKLLKLK